MPVNDDIADALTRHQIGLQRLSNATVRKIIALLEQSDERIQARLMRSDMSAMNRQRQERLLADIREILDSVYQDATGQLQIDLEALADYEGDYQLDMFRAQIPAEVDIGLTRPSANQIIAATNARPFQGRVLREWYKKLADDAKARFRTTIRMGIVEQRTNAQIVADLYGEDGVGGAVNIDRRAATTVVRTAVNHTATVARERVYSSNSRLIKGVQWLSTLDLRTSERCRGADGAVAWLQGYSRSDFPRGTRFLADVPSFTNESRPPAHYNCRSSTTPVLKSFQDLGLSGPDLSPTTRASMNGQVAADQTYSDWLRKQPADVQDEVLGKRKGALFRRGEITLDRFIAEDGDELTLDELRTRERAAWNRAFPS